jgi:hypothetical protein
MPTFFFPWKPNATLQAPLEAVACKRFIGIQSCFQ